PSHRPVPNLLRRQKRIHVLPLRRQQVKLGQPLLVPRLVLGERVPILPTLRGVPHPVQQRRIVRTTRERLHHVVVTHVPVHRILVRVRPPSVLRINQGVPARLPKLASQQLPLRVPPAQHRRPSVCQVVHTRERLPPTHVRVRHRRRTE